MVMTNSDQGNDHCNVDDEDDNDKCDNIASNDGSEDINFIDYIIDGDDDEEEEERKLLTVIMLKMKS